uniref:Thrombomodulin-like n=1 Tax=Erpetoichthys calabaricus TaxID=27687 RepID=A0A8C4SZ86_ERPCA
ICWNLCFLCDNFSLKMQLGVGAWPEVVLCSRNTCYMIHQGAADFHTANTTCSHRGGHLMTVQSTVHSDIISILMENLQGRFWIGLELPAGCCGDPSKALRGYQWVTGEEATDFSQWRTQDSSECGHQCVSISKDQLWEESSCLEVADGFLCEYNFNETCRAPEMEGFSLTCHTLLGFQMMDTAQLPPGTIAIIPCDSQHENDGCSHICEMEGSEAKCMCPEGLQLEGSQVTCETPDPCRNHPCEHLCVSRLQSYTCLCREGYLLDEDGLGCRDQDECLVQSICTPGQVCVNTPGSFRCTCPPGYVMVNGECEDPSRVEHVFISTFCRLWSYNTNGGLTGGCCDDGYSLSSEGFSCTPSNHENGDGLLPTTAHPSVRNVMATQEMSLSASSLLEMLRSSVPWIGAPCQKNDQKMGMEDQPFFKDGNKPLHWMLGMMDQLSEQISFPGRTAYHIMCVRLQLMWLDGITSRFVLLWSIKMAGSRNQQVCLQFSILVYTL